MNAHRVRSVPLSIGVFHAAISMAAAIFATSVAYASPEQCAAHWVERNRPFAERGLCVDTPLWKATFPDGSCTQTSGAEISIPPEISERLNEIRVQETQLGCRMDNQFDDPLMSARSFWLRAGEQASIFSARDGYANLRDAPGAKSGKVTGMLENGSQVHIVERVQSPDNGALWFRIRYADNIGRLHNAFVHHGTVFPRREVMGFLDIAPAAQLKIIDLGGEGTMPMMLRARFWTEDHPSDIWRVLSYPSYIRSGKEQRSFSVAFTALDWSGDELETVSSRCEWQGDKRLAACSGGAGEFEIIGVREQTTWTLRSLGLVLDNAASDAGRVVVAGFNRRVDMGAIEGRVQLGIAIDGIETLKSGVIHKALDTKRSSSSTSGETVPDGAAGIQASLPPGTAEALVDFDTLVDLME